jgi:hypothetical protein
MSVRPEYVVALYEFKGTDADHLSFKKGQVVEVLLKESDWWYGKLDSASGKCLIVVCPL